MLLKPPFSPLIEYTITIPAWARLKLLLILTCPMEVGAPFRTSRFPPQERLVAIILAVAAVLSPVFIDRMSSPDPETINISTLLPLLLFVLILAIPLSLYLDRSFTRFDPYWIHRVGGSSAGIVIVLIVLAFILKCKASASFWEA